MNRFLEGKVSAKTIELLDDNKAIFDIIKKAYLENNIELLQKVHPMEKEILRKKAHALIQKTKGKESLIVHYIIDSIRRFYQANSPLSGLIM